MAIITRKRVDTQITDLSGKEVDKSLNDAVKKNSPKNPKKAKKRGFLATTWDELMKVEWPTLGYTFRWSVVILLFTGIMAVSLGFFDNVFTSGIRFVDCTSPQSQGNSRTVQECGDELLRNITLRNS